MSYRYFCDLSLINDNPLDITLALLSNMTATGNRHHSLEQWPSDEDETRVGPFFSKLPFDPKERTLGSTLIIPPLHDGSSATRGLKPVTRQSQVCARNH
ncbi:hypothetical protein TNCV_3965471 [Trichonephila clavipes]|nr:hypothetical protein TNCV_3965471 [Trichonephila clavipes]